MWESKPCCFLDLGQMMSLLHLLLHLQNGNNTNTYFITYGKDEAWKYVFDISRLLGPWLACNKA